MRTDIVIPPEDNIKVTSVTEDGFWIIIRSTEYFCSFEKFPWFLNGTVEQIKDVEGRATHLFWYDLDIDLAEKHFIHLADITRPVQQPSPDE